MEITEVKIFPRTSEDRKLRAYATLTLDDCFVVRNVKVIEGNKGLFVAMPSRKLKEPCPKCGYKNVLRSKFCNQCGSSMPLIQPRMSNVDSGPRQSEHRDIAHPITVQCREYIQKKVLEAYDAELQGSGGPRAEPTEHPSARHAPQTGVPEAPKEPESPVEHEGDIEL